MWYQAQSKKRSLPAGKVEGGAVGWGEAGLSKAGRGRSCLQNQEMLLKPWFGTDLWNWEATGSPCFQLLRW